MSFTPPPHGLRVIHLPDRLVLHDITFALPRGDPSSRNALIDAANSVFSRRHSQSHLSAAPDLLAFDSPTPPSSATVPPSQPSPNRYLVLPFAPDQDSRRLPQPFETSSPQRAGVPNELDPSGPRQDAVPALLCLLPLHTAVYAVIATQVRRVADMSEGPVYAISKVSLFRLAANWQSKEEKELASAIAKHLESGSLYYSLHTDLSRPAHFPQSKKRPFQWNYPLTSLLPAPARAWLPIIIYGFVATHQMHFHVADSPANFNLTLISRRSRRRAGTRFITRGVDAMGDVANFVETEQIVWRNGSSAQSSFVIIRGSIPIFWRQTNGIARPPPELDASLFFSNRAFTRHFDALREAYSTVSAVSLVDKHGNEGVLANAFERHFDLYMQSLNDDLPFPKLLSFDFHAHCAGKEYERGLTLLRDTIQKQMDSYGFYLRSSAGEERFQQGVFRVNCVDCLDRTNVVQSMIARVVLNSQLTAVFADELQSFPLDISLRLFAESEDRFKHLWGDHADAISKQYSGTGALKTDFTRTGKRSTTGVIGDGMKSVMRVYYKNFVDEGRQEVIDIMCGNAVIRQQMTSTVPTAKPSPTGRVTGPTAPRSQTDPDSNSQVSSLWYSFEALRINAGGDKQAVYIDLHDDAMYVTTAESICFEYPRKSLLAWSNIEDGKSVDKRAPSKLRLWYKPSQIAPATSSPLDLLFRGGASIRENFLRALISWAQPEVAEHLGKHDIRVRVLAALNAGEHRLADWGLDGVGGKNELIALVVPECSAGCRPWDLAAVPVDVGFSNYVLISARAVSERGPAIAILASTQITPAIMTVNEATCERGTTFAASGAVAVALEVGGTSFCFVGTNLAGSSDMFAALSLLNLGKPSFDVTSQFHHFFLAGKLGDVNWRDPFDTTNEPSSRKWITIEDGSRCYTLQNGLSIMRNSFPSLTYDGKLSEESTWNEAGPVARNSELKLYACMADAIVEGHPVPHLAQNPKKCTVTLSEMRAENVTIPKGVEQGSQMTALVVLYCKLAVVDGVVSRQTTRPTSHPEWVEPLSLVMMASEPEDIFKEFVLGQVLLPTPLNDPITAGQFVVPLSLAQQGRAKFEVPCRLAGTATGRIFGIIDIDFRMGRDGDDSFASASGLPSRAHSTIETGFDSGRHRSFAGETRVQSDISGPLQRGSSAMGSRPVELSSSSKQRGALDDVNDRLEAARRRGAKQMKSVATKLSSLLTQPSAASQSHHSPADGVPDGFISADNGGRPGYSSGLERRNAPIGTMGDGRPGPVRSARPTTAADGPVERSQISIATGSRAGRNQSSAADDFTNFADFQSAAVPTCTSSRLLADQPDPLLLGLSQARSAKTLKQQRPRVVPAHVDDGSDLLLNGLAKRKDPAEAPTTIPNDDDDNWGDFESVVPATTSRAQKNGASGSGSTGRSLFDF